jgi:hypothetical protein
MPGNAAFHPTIKTVGFQTAFSVNGRKGHSGVAGNIPEKDRRKTT